MEERLRDTRTLVAQLRDRLENLIKQEGLHPGDRLPTEAQLTARFKVSRPALREALKLLEQDDIIFVEHGRGRFVSAASAVRVQRPITVFESVSDMTSHYGYRVTNKVLSIAEAQAQETIRESLKLAQGETVIRLERLRFEKGEPIMYCVDFVPRRILAGPLDKISWEGSLLSLMEGHQQRPRMSAASVSAVLLPEKVISDHQLQHFGPALLISETCFNAVGEPVNYAMDYHRGSHFSFSLVRK